MSEMKISVDPENEGNANLIYILYLVGLAVGLTAIVGVVMAYIGRGQANEMLASHYTNHINLFWKFLLYMIVGAILSPVLIGLVVIGIAYVWLIVRCVKGMQAVSRNQGVEEPGRWGF